MIVGYYDDVKIEIDCSSDHINMKASNLFKKPSMLIPDIIKDMGVKVDIGNDYVLFEYNIYSLNSEVFYHRLERMYTFLVWTFDSEDIKYTFDEIFPVEAWLS